jgi:hypothetical protein
VSDHHNYIIARAPELSDDEAELMREIFDRVLVVGRSRYSPWVALADKRNLVREGDEEIWDAIIYPGMLRVRKRRERAERLRCFKADEDFKRTNVALVEFAALVDAEDSACTDCLGINGNHGAGCAWQVLR